MSSLRTIKKRITNISMMEKTTQSMKVISTSRLFMAKNNIVNTKEYFSTSFKILSNLFHLHKNSAEAEKNKEIFDVIFGDEDKEGQTVLICVSSDRGLCGAYNSNISKLLIKEVDILGLNNVLIVPIGKKSISYTEKHYKDNLLCKVESSDIKKINSTEINFLVDLLINMIKDKKINKVKIIFTKSQSILEQVAQVDNILPISLSNVEAEKNMITDKKNFEDTLLSLLNHYFRDAIYNKINISAVAEHSMRLNAMDNAYNNCKDLKTALTLEYNRTRQSIITKELIEIISGAEAI